MTDEPQAPRKQTWEEWIPDGYPPPADDDLRTREEIMGALHAMAERGFGEDVSERTIRHWESLGILPSPVRRRFKGATRAVYPSWFFELAMLAAAFANSRKSTEERAREVRDMVPIVIRNNVLHRSNLVQHSLPEQLGELSNRYAALTGERPRRARLQLQRDDGSTAWEHTFPLEAANSNK
jgi:hypothetical protein